MDGFKIALRYSLGHMVSYFRDRTHIYTGKIKHTCTYQLRENKSIHD